MRTEKVFNSVEEAVKTLKLDRRRKWGEYSGLLCTNAWVTVSCSGCSEYDEGYFRGAMGCSECGYTGKRRNLYPNPYQDENALFVKISPSSLETKTF